MFCIFKQIYETGRTCHMLQSWALADHSVIGASGLSDDDDGKNDGLKWKLAESVR
jgi:hypothetical protein